VSFRPLNTKDDTTSFHKTLLYAVHGWGKTTQAKYYQKRYGKGFIISGESGLSSIRSAGIDYLPFTSFDGPNKPDEGIYSFTGICRLMMSKEFKAAGYKWIMLDSLTELSDLCFTWADDKATAEAAAANKKLNGFDVWASYGDKFIGACKFLRDLPYHVCLTALAAAKTTEDQEVERWPLVQGNKIAGQLAGVFDNVFCGLSKEVKLEGGTQATERAVITGKIGGWQGKVRDEHGVVDLVEKTGDITTILNKIEASQAAGQPN
jgi:hypothetical protein